MRQRAAENPPADFQWFHCETPLGWIGVLGNERTVHRLWLGYESLPALHAEVDSWGTRNGVPVHEMNWWPELRSRLIRYAQGKPVDFSDVAVHDPRATPFQTAVLKATRKVGFGETLTYGELAARAGQPRAARAVGSVMSGNPVPLIVPCHRVVAAGRKLGGYTSPQGVCMKQRLLELENAR